MTRPSPRARAGPDGARAREQLSTATAWGLDTAISLNRYRPRRFDAVQQSRRIVLITAYGVSASCPSLTDLRL